MIIDQNKRLFYTAFKLPKRDPFEVYDLDEQFVLTKLASVNIFVGSNNCGKSRFLRGLFIAEDYGFKTNLFSGSELQSFLSRNNAKGKYGSSFVDACRQLEPFPELLNRYFREGGGYLKRNIEMGRQLREFADNARNIIFEIVNKGNIHFAPQWVSNEVINPFIRELIEDFSEKKFNPKNIGKEKRFYIPILRGMRPPSSEASKSGLLNIYAERAFQDYFSSVEVMRQNSANYPAKLFTGLELYQRLHDQLLGEPDEREAVRAFESFLSGRFFDGKEVTLIPKTRKDVVHIKIGSELQLPIFNLGDGLQNLIIVTYEMFMQKERCLFFIEEPDLSMHPGMQRALLEVMAEFNRHQYFLTTHSNHLLDMSSEFKDTSIYLFTKEHQANATRFRIKQASSPDTSILKELGVHNSSVFLTNATIWVEGITDRLYLRAYLKKYFEKLLTGEEKRAWREDYHYSFVEYQGSNLTHWTFDNADQSSKIKTSFLCARSFLIADGDVSEKGTRAADYREMLGEHFCILDCKEIENLIPEEVLRELVKEEFAKLGKDVTEISFKRYGSSKTGLGKYLDSLLGKEVFASESGTIRSKVNFCERVVEILGREGFVWNLTPPLEGLCRKVHQFISDQNK